VRTAVQRLGGPLVHLPDLRLGRVPPGVKFTANWLLGDSTAPPADQAGRGHRTEKQLVREVPQCALKSLVGASRSQRRYCCSDPSPGSGVLQYSHCSIQRRLTSSAVERVD
jgi:hypothetical protein